MSTTTMICPVCGMTTGMHVKGEPCDACTSRSVSKLFDAFMESEIQKIKKTGMLPDYVSKPSNPKTERKNGAFCNEYGRIYLRVVSLDTSQEGCPMRTVDHGIGIDEAHCIAVELMSAIQKSSQITTGRYND